MTTRRNGAPLKGFDPNTFVGYGPRTDDEMQLGFIGYVEVDEETSTTTTNNN